MMAASTESSTLKRNCGICGYHVYHSICDVTVGEELLCERELTNLHDRYAVAARVAVIKNGNVIRRLLTTVIDYIIYATVDKYDGPFRY